MEQAAERAVALGAKVLHRELGLVISSSPGGFTFCLVRWHGESTVPGPVQLDDAGASRADQFWLDIPAGVYERERSFWSALTGWEGQDGARSVRLGFQPCDDAGPVTGRLGFSFTDRERLAADPRGTPPRDRDGRPRRPFVPPDRTVTDGRPRWVRKGSL